MLWLRIPASAHTNASVARSHAAYRVEWSWLAGILPLRPLALAASLLLLLASLGGGSGLAPAAPGKASWRAAFRYPVGIPFPQDSPFDARKASLGRLLFFDPLLSGPQTRSCASCHSPALAWSDSRPMSRGVRGQNLGIRTPTLLDGAWLSAAGWDGRFDSIDDVAFAAIEQPDNMGSSEAEVVGRLSSIPGYVRAFDRAFPGQGIDRASVSAALGSFLRTIVSGPAPFDRWLAGDRSAISQSAERGFALFRGRANCAACHSGWAFTDGSFHDTGIAAGDDLGRGRLFPSSVKLQHAFKTPTLRDVARRAPFGHDGSMATLAQVVERYDSGGIDRPSRAEQIHPLGLSAADKADLVAFLDTLSTDRAEFLLPPLPR